MKPKILFLALMLFGLLSFSQGWQHYNAFAPGDTGPIGSRNTACLSKTGNLILATEVAIPTNDPAPFPLVNYLLLQELEKTNGSLLQEKVAYVPYYPGMEAKGMIRYMNEFGEDEYHILTSTGAENTNYADCSVVVFDEQFQLKYVKLLSAALNHNRVLFNTGEAIEKNYSCFFRREVVCVIGESGMGQNAPQRQDIVYMIYDPVDFTILASNKLSILPYDADGQNEIHISAISPTDDGAFVFSGSVTGPTDQIPFVGKIGPDGSTEWVNLYKTGTYTLAVSQEILATRDTLYLHTDQWMASLDYQGLVIAAYRMADPMGNPPAIYSMDSHGSQLILAGSSAIAFNPFSALISWAYNYPSQDLWEAISPDGNISFLTGQDTAHTTAQAVDFASGVTNGCFETIDYTVSTKSVIPRSWEFLDSSLLVTVSTTYGDFPYACTQADCYEASARKADHGTVETIRSVLELSGENFELVNMAGQVLFSVKSSGNKESSQMDFQKVVSMLPSGLYILRYPSESLLISL